MDEPSIVFNNASYPARIGFKEEFEISLVAKKTSLSIPTSVEVAIKPLPTMFNMDELESSMKLVAEATALNLNEGENELKIVAKFKDGNGRGYAVEEEITIIVEKANFVQKIQRFFLRLFS